MIYIYRAEPSDGARALAEAVGGYKVSVFSQRKRRKPNDVIVCWGEENPNITGLDRVLNGAPIHSKYMDALSLRAAGVPTIEVSQTNPGNRGEVFWLARKNNHVGGDDLLNMLETQRHADYYSKYIKFEKEFRIHCFNGKSLRGGQKVPREGVTPHEWIRSFDAGWKISYDAFKSSKELREVAASAIKALGLDFGAVDIGRISKGSYVVLEVNRAPGLEGNTITTYAEAIKAWAGNP